MYKKVFCLNDEPEEYAIYKRVDDKMILKYCNFHPNYFEEEMSIEEFDVEFAWSRVEDFKKEL